MILAGLLAIAACAAAGMGLAYLLSRLLGVFGFVLGFGIMLVGSLYALIKVMYEHFKWFDKQVVPRCPRCGGGMRSRDVFMRGGRNLVVRTYCPTCDRSADGAAGAGWDDADVGPAAMTGYALLAGASIAALVLPVIFLIYFLVFDLIDIVRLKQAWLVRAKLAITSSSKLDDWTGKSMMRDAIFAAAQRNDLETFKVLFERSGGYVNPELSVGELIGNPEILKYATSKNAVSLHSAAREGRADAAARMIEAGARINERDARGWTPLHTAGGEGSSAVAALLIEKGARVDVKDGDGYTPLHRAAQEGKTDTARLLLEKGADVNARDNNGSTPLHVAARMGRLEIASLLLEKGAKVNLRTVRPWANVNFGEKTPLHDAAWEEKAEVAQLLVRKGADVNARTTEQLTPLWMAKKKENAKLVDILKRAGAK